MAARASGISSTRLVLRTLSAHEAERILAGSHPATGRDPGSDPTAEVSRPRFADGYPSTFATQVLRLVALHPAIDQFQAGDEPDLGPWLVLRGDDDAVLGTISCARSGAGEVCVGYDIASSCRGEGYATEALGSVVEHLLGQPGINRVTAETHAEHHASRRVMEKAGLRWLGDQGGGPEDREVTLVRYGIDRAARS